MHPSASRVLRPPLLKAQTCHDAHWNTLNASASRDLATRSGYTLYIIYRTYPTPFLRHSCVLFRRRAWTTAASGQCPPGADNCWLSANFTRL
eukprot:533439-Prorocentrum_minimum.AAC.2